MTLRCAVDLLTKSLSSASLLTNTESDLEILDRSVQTVMEMLDRVLAYVRSVISGEIKGDAVIGRYLLDTFATSTDGLDQGSFASSLQVSSMAIAIKYLFDLILFSFPYRIH